MASILKVDTITGVATAGSIAITGEGNSTTTNLQQGLCKAWFEMAGDFLLDDSLNIASTTDDGTGLFSFTYTNSMANSNYALNASPTGGARNTTFIWIETTNLSTAGAASSMGTHTGSTTSLSDADNAMALHGDLA